MARLADNANYTTNPVVIRSFTVHKATQAVSHNIPAQFPRNAGSVPLMVSASSGLPVVLTIDDLQVATLNGNNLNVLRLGTIRITLTQEGNANYFAATPVTVTVSIVAGEGTDGGGRDPSGNADEFAKALGLRVHPAVSPNGDGVNDYLIIEGIRDYIENKVTIFTKNGTLVYNTSGYNNDRVKFEGMGTGGNRLPAGTYYYIIEVNDNGQWRHKKGFFVLRY